MKRILRLCTALGAALCAPEAAQACAVCFGDPNSAMVKGVNAGILVLLGIIGCVLLSIAGVALFWACRARQCRLAAQRKRFSAAFPGAGNGALAAADAE